MGGTEGCFMRSMGMQVDCNGTTITLPNDFTWILFRHGDKTNQSPTRGGELTFYGECQVCNSAYQLADKFRLATKHLHNANIISSPIYRVQQSATIIAEIIYAKPNNLSVHAKLEWGPNDGHQNDADVINLLRSFNNNTVIAVGHNGLFENIAQIIHPREKRYHLPAGAAFIITPAGIEIIKPRI